MKPHQFEFNESQCCLNPIKEVIFFNGKLSAEIKLADFQGNWIYGYHIISSECGGGCASGACFSEKRERFSTIELARKAAIEYTINVFEKEQNKLAISKLKSILLPKQIELF